jgi:hypothetical protein
VTNDMRIAQEEVFGPVMTVIKVRATRGREIGLGISMYIHVYLGGRTLKGAMPCVCVLFGRQAAEASDTMSVV